MDKRKNQAKPWGSRHSNERNWSSHGEIDEEEEPLDSLKEDDNVSILSTSSETLDLHNLGEEERGDIHERRLYTKRTGPAIIVKLDRLGRIIGKFPNPLSGAWKGYCARHKDKEAPCGSFYFSQYRDFVGYVGTVHGDQIQIGFGRRTQGSLQYELSSFFLDKDRFSSYVENVEVDNSTASCKQYEEGKTRCLNSQQNTNEHACVRFIQGPNESKYREEVPSIHLKETLFKISESGILPPRSGCYEREKAPGVVSFMMCLSLPLSGPGHVNKIVLFIEHNTDDQWTRLGFGWLTEVNLQEKIWLWITDASPGEIRWIRRMLTNKCFVCTNNHNTLEDEKSDKWTYVTNSNNENDLSISEEVQRRLESLIGVGIWTALFEGEGPTTKYLSSLSPESLVLEVNSYGPKNTRWEDLTPFIWAAKTGNLKMLKLLLSFHADKEKTRKYHQSNPLHYACAYDQKDVIVYLVKEVKMKIDRLAYNRCNNLSVEKLLQELQESRRW